MFKIINNEIALTRGDSASFDFACIDESTGEAYDFSNDTVLFSIKRFPGDAEPLIQKTLSEENKFELEPSDTAGLSFGQYYYDVVINRNDGSVATVIPFTPITLCYEVH